MTDDKCICGEINARHCQIHQDDQGVREPSEWLKNSSGVCIPIFPGEKNGDPANQVHVIEKSAYRAMEVAAERWKQEAVERASVRDQWREMCERMAGALKQIDAEWCQHSQVRLDQIPTLDRDWCSHCTTWIYRNEINHAKQALAEYEKFKAEIK